MTDVAELYPLYYCEECNSLCKKSGQGICCNCPAPAINWSKSERTHPKHWVKIENKPEISDLFNEGSTAILWAPREEKLLAIEKGFYCTKCNRQCHWDGYNSWWNCDCHQIAAKAIENCPYCWTPVTVTITKRSGK